MGRGAKARDQARKRNTQQEAGAETRFLRLGVKTTINGALAPEPLQPISAPEMAATFWPFAAICVVASVSLGLAWFVGDQSTYVHLFPHRLRLTDWLLGFKAWWVVWCFTGV